MLGKKASGEEGYFPSNYVEVGRLSCETKSFDFICFSVMERSKQRRIAIVWNERAEDLARELEQSERGEGAPLGSAGHLGGRGKEGFRTPHRTSCFSPCPVTISSNLFALLEIAYPCLGEKRCGSSHNNVAFRHIFFFFFD